MPQNEAPIDDLVKTHGSTAVIVYLIFWFIIVVIVATGVGAFITEASGSNDYGFWGGVMAFFFLTSFFGVLFEPEESTDTCSD